MNEGLQPAPTGESACQLRPVAAERLARQCRDRRAKVADASLPS
jgi:hypothetical protein